MGKKVAVLAVQGAFIEHERALSKLGCECVELRQGPDVRQPFDALVLPGGESTVQAKLLRELGMIDERTAALRTAYRYGHLRGAHPPRENRRGRRSRRR